VVRRRCESKRGEITPACRGDEEEEEEEEEEQQQQEQQQQEQRDPNVPAVPPSQPPPASAQPPPQQQQQPPPQQMLGSGGGGSGGGDSGGSFAGWGSAGAAERCDFRGGLTRLVDELGLGLRSQQWSVRLARPAARWADVDVKPFPQLAAKAPELREHFQGLLRGWVEQIEGCLAEAEALDAAAAAAERELAAAGEAEEAAALAARRRREAVESADIDAAAAHAIARTLARRAAADAAAAAAPAASRGGVDVGPRVELAFWTRRTRRLNSVCEQLRGKACATVSACLAAAQNNLTVTADAPAARQQLGALLARWHAAAAAAEEAAAEAADNARYLGTLERYLPPLYEAPPPAVAQLLPALFHAVRLIGGLSRHFNTPRRVGSLLARCSLAVLVCAVRHVAADDAWAPPEDAGLLAAVRRALRRSADLAAARGGGGGGGGGRGSARPASAHPRTRYSPAEGKSVGSGVGDSAAGLMGSALESKTGGRDYGAALAGSPKRDAGRGGGSSGDGDSDCGGGGVLGETDDSQAFPERGPGLPPATVAGAKRGPGLPPATGAGGAIGGPPLPLAVEPQRPPVALAPPQASVEPIVASSSSSSSSSSVTVLAAASGDSASQIQAEMRDMLIFMRRSQEQQAEAMRRHIDHIESRMQVRDESRLGDIVFA